MFQDNFSLDKFKDRELLTKIEEDIEQAVISSDNLKVCVNRVANRANLEWDRIASPQGKINTVVNEVITAFNNQKFLGKLLNHLQQNYSVFPSEDLYINLKKRGFISVEILPSERGDIEKEEECQERKALKKTIRGKLQEILQGVDKFTQILNEEAKKCGFKGDLVDILLEKSLQDLIILLFRNAMFQVRNDKDLSSQEKEKFWQSSQEIVNWLVLLALSDEWLQKQCWTMLPKGFLEGKNSATLPVKKDFGVDIILANAEKRAARLKENKQGEPQSQDAILYNHSEALEAGFEIEDQVGQIKHFLWKKVYNVEDADIPAFGSNREEKDTETLNCALKFRNIYIDYGNLQSKENYPYLVLKSNEERKEETLKLYSRISNDLNHLRIVFILPDSDQKNTFASELNEPELRALLREFFRANPII